MKNGNKHDGKVYLHAHQNRQLIAAIDASKALYNTLTNTEHAFEINDGYKKFFDFVRPFLVQTGGSNVDIDTCWTDLEPYYSVPIFRKANGIKIERENNVEYALKEILGSGSYATVSKYKDGFYNEWFAVKELKTNATEKDWERFKNEFNTLKGINSPYVVHVYKFFEDKRAYVMEAMDGTIENLCQSKELPKEKRINLSLQIIRRIRVIHKKGLCHRDICPSNILYKRYDDCNIVKISDFGLVKNPFNKMTSAGSEVKGHFVDQKVEEKGFSKYRQMHDLYSLAMTLVFVLWGNIQGMTNIRKCKTWLEIQRTILLSALMNLKSIIEMK